MTRIFLWLAALVSLLTVISLVGFSETKEMHTDTILRVVDGDTVILTHDETRVRIVDINTPETVKPGSPVQCWGREATEFAKMMLAPGTKVQVEVQSNRDGTHLDKYGRTLAYLEYDQSGNWVDYSTEAARMGLTKPYLYDNYKHPRYDDIVAASNEAQQNRIGLWSNVQPSDCSPVS